VTQARDELADLVNRVAYGHERIILTRHSKPVAGIVSPEDLAWLEQRAQEAINLTSAGPTGDIRPQTATSDLLPIAAEHRPPSRPGVPGSPSL
jgi:prevent-host-death family protein